MRRDPPARGSAACHSCGAAILSPKRENFTIHKELPMTRPPCLTGDAEDAGLHLLGASSRPHFDAPDASILESFPNRYPERHYVITLEHPEFTSLCPLTGQPDFGTIRVRYVPGRRCLESKSFKLYLGAFRNQGGFMESLTNRIADDIIAAVAPRRICVEGLFNARGGTRISVRVDAADPALTPEERSALPRLEGG
jgi:7-cyano-7-deazaguanine reductase